MSKYDDLLKRIEVFEKFAHFSDQNSFLKSLSQQSVAPSSPNYKYKVTDSIIPNKDTITNKDSRFDTGGFQPHDEMIDETEDELTSEQIKAIEDAKNKPVFAALSKLKTIKI